MADCLVLIIVTSVWSWRHQTYFASLATSHFCPSEGHCETVSGSVRGYQASTVQRHIWTFLVLKLCHEKIKISNMHLSQFSSNFKSRFFHKSNWQNSNSKYWSIMFLVNLPKFGRKICSNDHAVSFWDKSNGVLRHGVQRTTHHALTSACLHEGLAARRNQTKIPIFVNLLSANIGHKNQQNNASTHIQ